MFHGWRIGCEPVYIEAEANEISVLNGRDFDQVNATCPQEQGTVLHNLFQVQLNTGLTVMPTESSIP